MYLGGLLVSRKIGWRGKFFSVISSRLVYEAAPRTVLPNPAPVFGVRGARAVGARRVGTNHLRFTLDDGSGVLPAIGFRWADDVPDSWLAQPLDVAFKLERDEWQGRTTLQARVAALAPTK